MGISGSLKDVSVADVMQFIHLGRRTGTLLLNRGVQKAMIGFHMGRLVSAQAPRTPKLGDLLITSGMIDRGILERRQSRLLGMLPRTRWPAADSSPCLVPCATIRWFRQMTHGRCAATELRSWVVSSTVRPAADTSK